MSRIVAVVVAVAVTTAEGPATRAHDEPDVQVYAMQHGPPPSKRGWSMTLDASGRLKLEWLNGEAQTAVPIEKRRELLGILTRAGFFELKDEYGVGQIGSDFRAVKVTVDGRTKTVRFASDLDAEPDKEGLKRALRVWIAVTDLPALPAILDTRNKDASIVTR